MRNKSKVIFLSALAFFGLTVAATPIHKSAKVAKAETVEKITSYGNISSGSTYYIGATTSSTDYYLSLASGTGSVKGTAVTSKESATVFTFTGSGTTWSISLSDGNFITLSSSKSNGNVIVQSTSANWSLSNNNSLLRLSANNSYSLQKNNSGTQFGSYGNNQTDVWLEAANTAGVTKYNVTQNLTSISSDFTGSHVNENAPLSIQLTANKYCEIVPSSVVVTMGGSTLSNVFDSSTNKISIASVTGDVVITAEAVTADEFDVSGTISLKSADIAANYVTNAGKESGYLKMSDEQYIKIPFSAFEIPSGKVAVSDIDISIYAGYYGGSFSSTFNVDLLDSSDSSLASGNASYTLSSNSENALRGTITLKKPEDASAIAFVKVSVDFSASGKFVRLGKIGYSFTVGDELTLQSITVKTSPAKTVYNSGEKLSPTGLVITATYDKKTEDISYANHSSEFSFTPSLDTSLSTQNSVTVTYKGQTATFNIDVLSYSGLVIKTNPTKVTYREGEKFNPADIVVQKELTHSSGIANTFETVSTGLSYSISGETVTTNTSLLKGDDQVVTVSYTEGGVTKTATFTIDVGSPYVTGITASSSEVTLGPGNELQLTATISPNTADQGYEVQLLTADGNLNGKYTFQNGVLKINADNDQTGDIKLAVISNDINASGEHVEATCDVHVIATKVSTLQGVKITGTPAHSTQYVGKTFDKTGLTFEPIFDNEPAETVTIGDTDIIWDTLVSGEHPTGSYTYGGVTVQVKVESVTVEADALASIAISGSLTKTQYYENETAFSSTGLSVTGTMKSGDTVDTVSGVTFSFNKKPNEMSVGDGTVTVTASKDGVSPVTANLDVTILANAIQSITVDASDMKVNYILGESIDTTGLKINATYANSSESDITSGFTTNADSISTLSVGDKTLTVTYKGKTANVTIHVAAKVIETKNTWTKVTAEQVDWSGTYAVGYVNDNSVSLYNGLDSAGEYDQGTLTSAGIADQDDIVSIIVASMSGGYSIKINGGENDGKYISGTSGSNTTNFGSSASACTITYDSNSSSVLITSNTSVLRFNTGTNQFRFYKSSSYASQAAIQLFKYSQETTGVAEPIAMTEAIYGGDESNLKVGDKVVASDFAATVLYNDGNSVDVDSGLTINGGSEVTLVEGSNTITVAYGSFTQDVVINARALRVTDYTLVDTDDDIEVFGGATIQLEALQESDGNDPDQVGVTWSSNNTDVATVDSNGLVTTKVVSADNTKVTITATPTDGGTAGSIVITVNKDDITGIELASNPTKVSYKYGENFNAAGLSVKYVYESGNKSEPIAYDSSTFTLSVADGTALNNSMTSVDVTFGGYTLNKAFALTIGKIATALTITGYKNEIYENQTYALGNTAVATVTYSDDSTSNVTIPSDNVSVDTSTPGDVQGTAFIEIDGVKVSTTLDVTVKEDKVSSIQFEHGPDEYDYNHHDSFDPKGIVITVKYESGASEEVQYNDSRLTYSPTTLDTVGEQTITATFTDAHGNTASADVPQKVIVSKTVSKVEIKSYEVYKDYNAAGTNTPVSGDIYQSDNITIKAVITTTYSDGTTRDVTKLVSFGMLVEGENTTTTTVDGVTLSFKIEGVIGVELSSIILDTTNVTKTGYIEGQTADLSGLVVKAHYNNGVDVVLNSDQYTVQGTTDLTTGQNTITVSFGGKSATFIVSAEQKQVSSVELVGTQTETYLTEAEIASLAGNGYQLKVNYNNNTSEIVDITKTMVSVNGNTVTVTYAGKTATYSIVALTPTTASTISLENAAGTATVGDTYTFNPGTVTAHFLGTDKTLVLPAGSYTVDAVDTSVPGQATYYVTVNGTSIKASFTVQVSYAQVSEVTISGDTTSTYAPNDTVQLSADVNPDNANQGIVWSSSDESVATVSNTGLVTFHKAGSVTIKATSAADSTKFATVTLNCEVPVVHVTGITVTEETKTIELFDSFTISYSVSPNNADNKTVTFVSNNESVATVNSSGVVTGIKEGTATITITTVDGSYQATITVTVKAPTVDPIGPVNPVGPTVEPDANFFEKTADKVKDLFGCSGSIIGASAIISLASLAGASLLVSKKRKDDDK